MGPDGLGVNTGPLIAQLIGDFAPFKQPYDLSSKMFVAPTSPAGSPRAHVPYPFRAGGG